MALVPAFEPWSPPGRWMFESWGLPPESGAAEHAVECRGALTAGIAAREEEASKASLI
jgi:hypothetical protein